MSGFLQKPVTRGPREVRGSVKFCTNPSYFLFSLPIRFNTAFFNLGVAVAAPGGNGEGDRCCYHGELVDDAASSGDGAG
jgi:hypothetical protein